MPDAARSPADQNHPAPSPVDQNHPTDHDRASRDGHQPATAPFDLPESLSAKADPQLIADDVHHFAAIAASLRRQVAELTDQLAALRRDAVRQGQAALERDLQIHRTTAQLRALGRYGVNLCLGRIVPDDGSDPIYIGRSGLSDGAGNQLLVDWRTPAAEPFFAATHAQPMGLASRRRYRWTLEQITDYWDEAFTAGALHSDASLDDESAFISSLGENRSEHMRDVLGTIQADQDAIIRAGSQGALVVDGGPGTGKTVVALHRAAYLLYADPRLGRRRGGVLFVGPHHRYLNYVSDVLPSLGEDGVRLCTLSDLVPYGDLPAETDQRVAEVKSRAQLVAGIADAVRFFEEPPTKPLPITSSWGDVVLRPKHWSSAFAAVDPGTPHNIAREQIWQALLNILLELHDDEDIDAGLLRRDMAQHEELVATFNRAWPLLTERDLVADLYSVPAYLRLAAPSLTPQEAQLLQRADPYAFTESDLPLLDAARRRLGDPQATRHRRSRAAAISEQQDYMSQVVDELIDADDDGEGLVTQLSVADMQQRILDEDVLPTTSRDELAGPFAHIVVDEAQELTDAQWQMLRSRCPSGSFTVVGDRAQARHGFAESWQQRLARAGLAQAVVRSLSVNYRTPSEVMAVAEPAIRQELPDANVPTSIRSSGTPVRHRAIDELDGVLEEWLAEHPTGIACVIATDPAPALGGHLALERVSVLAPDEVKGLEFDLVVLVDPARFGTGIEGAVDRYVAMTRSTSELVLLGEDAT